ncbi:MAG: hypothetical protein GY765_32170 [bacterium]|nr:hypothetical protein [bacterium]
MKIDKTKLQEKNGFFQGKVDAVDRESAQAAVDYKRKVAKKFVSITPEQIDFRVKGDNLFVTRKIDGELAVVFYEDGTAFIINSGGTVRMDLPPLVELAETLQKAGIKSALLAAELHVQEKGERKRVFDLLSALADKNAVDSIRLTVFDIVSIDDRQYNIETFDTVFEKIEELFKETKKVTPVQTEKVSKTKEIKELYSQWVGEENAEGIVIRSEMPFIYKVKTKHTVDAVIVGFTEKSGVEVPVFDSLLMALQRDDQTYQIIAKAANGLSEEDEVALYNKLKDIVIESDHIETNRHRVAYRMVKPEYVIELGFHDVLLETGKGEIKNTLLKLEENRFSFLSIAAGVSILHPVIDRVRDDKAATLENLRFSQVTDLVYIPGFKKEIEALTLEKSEVISREVYVKQSKGKQMVQKFVVWKTNKEKSSDRYLAYVLHYTNFSPGRKDMLKREVRISSDKDQIMAIAKELVAKNIKKGWEPI